MGNQEGHDPNPGQSEPDISTRKGLDDFNENATNVSKVTMILLGVLIVTILLWFINGVMASFHQSAADRAMGGPSDKATHQGLREGDVVASFGETLDGDGMRLTVGPLFSQADLFGDPIVCSDIVMLNSGETPRGAGLFDWQAHNPDGSQMGVNVFGGEGEPLPSGELEPGEEFAGEVCFDSESDPRDTVDEYAVFYELLDTTSPARLVWFNSP